MTGGEISGNTVTGKGAGEGGGGGIRMYPNAVFIASGGGIKDNTALYGGGVFVGAASATNGDPAAQFTLSGATVSGNQATDTYGDGGASITTAS